MKFVDSCPKLLVTAHYYAITGPGYFESASKHFPKLFQRDILMSHVVKNIVFLWADIECSSLLSVLCSLGYLSGLSVSEVVLHPLSSPLGQVEDGQEGYVCGRVSISTVCQGMLGYVATS